MLKVFKMKSRDYVSAFAIAAMVLTISPVFVSAAPVVSISVSPATTIVAVGSTKQLTAFANDIAGMPASPQPTIAWITSDPAIGTVNSSGLFIPVAPGVVTVTASSGVISGASMVTVVPLGAPIFSTITVSSLQTDIAVGSSYQLSAMAVDSTGWPVFPQPTLTWSSSDTAVATVSASGLVTGVAVGTAAITASNSGINGILSMAVSPVNAPVIASIYVGPRGPIVAVGSTKLFSATAYGSSGIIPLSPQPVFAWTSSDAAVGTMDAAGLFTAVAPGTAIISAASGAIIGTTTIIVVPVGGATFGIVSIQATDGSFGGNIAVGATKQLSAVAWDSSGMAQASPQPTFTWSSSNSTIATVSPAGLFTAVAPGPVTITASALGVNGSFSAIVVSATPYVSAIYVSPNPTFFNVGATYPLAASAHDQFGTVMATQPAFTWSSNNNAVGTVDPATGIFTAVSSGTVTITASSGGINGTINITVVASGAAALTAINITQVPASNTLQIGQGVGLKAIGVDEAGANFFPQPAFTWSTSNSAVMAVTPYPDNSMAYIKAISAGTAIITVSGSGISGTVTMTAVNDPGCGTSISVSPPSASITVGNTQQLAATVFDQYGAAMPGATVYWLNSAPGIASVSASGLVTGIIPGQASATPTTNGCFGVVYGSGTPITVSSVPGTFGITSAAGAGGTISPLGYTGVVAGAPQAYTITPDVNYHLTSVLIDGAPILIGGATANYTFINVVAPHTISATFAIDTFNILASAGVNGAISPAGTSTVNAGGSQTYTITPSLNYSVANALVDGVSVGAVTAYTFTNVLASHTISATFTLNANSITASAGANGTISPLGTTAVSYGANQIFAISPNAGYQIADVQVDGVSIGATANYTFINVVAPHTISATFSAATYSGISASAGINGAISPAGTLIVANGANQSFVITPDVNYHVQDVLVDGISVGAITSYIFTNITTTHSISATFAINTNDITASAGANGVISPAGVTAVPYGSSQTFTVTPNAGFSVADVLVDGMSVGTATSYTFTNVVAPHSISASFIALSNIILIVNMNAGWNLVAMPSQPIDLGSGLPITYTAETFGALAGADVVARWNSSAQAYSSHIVGLPVNNFLIAGGEGVFVHATTTGTFFITGAPGATTTSALAAGWNSLGWSGDVSIAAEALGLSLAAVDVVAKFDSLGQVWSSHIVGLPVNNFTINPGNGVFVHRP